MTKTLEQLEAEIAALREENAAINKTMLMIADTLGEMIEKTGIISRRDLSRSLSANVTERRKAMEPAGRALKAELDLIDRVAQRLLEPTEATVKIEGEHKSRLQ